MEKRIAIIGAGGRTGTMLAFEIGKNNDVLGVARKDTIDFLKDNELYVDNGEGSFLFKGKIIEDTEFSEENCPDIIFLTNKNPIASTLNEYSKKCGDKKPIFVLSQNGIDAIDSAEKVLGELEGSEVVRMVLFNAIDRKKNVLKYSLPVKVAIAQVLGDKGVKEVFNLFKKSGFNISKFSKKDARNLEFSKLFLNLIGMASASRGMSITDGFRDKEVFVEEIKALREYVSVVRSAKGRFVDFPGYPINLFVLLLSLPLSLLILFRDKIAKVVNKGRGDKSKDLDEIDYYNGAVVNLAREIEEKVSSKDLGSRVVDSYGRKVLINQQIYWRVLEKIKNS